MHPSDIAVFCMDFTMGSAISRGGLNLPTPNKYSTD